MSPHIFFFRCWHCCRLCYIFAGADKIAVIDKGQVVEMGKHDELLAQEGLYAQVRFDVCVCVFDK